MVFIAGQAAVTHGFSPVLTWTNPFRAYINAIIQSFLNHSITSRRSTVILRLLGPDSCGLLWPIVAHRLLDVGQRPKKKGHLRAYLLINSLTCLQWNPRNPKIKAPLFFIRTQDSLSVAIKNNKAWRQWEDSASVENSASNLIISSTHWPG
jgi:hypothetical protein